MDAIKKTDEIANKLHSLRNKLFQLRIDRIHAANPALIDQEFADYIEEFNEINVDMGQYLQTHCEGVMDNTIINKTDIFFSIKIDAEELSHEMISFIERMNIEIELTLTTIKLTGKFIGTKISGQSPTQN